MDAFMKSIRMGDDVTLAHGDNVIIGKIQSMTDDTILLRVNSRKCEAEIAEKFTEIQNPYARYVGSELVDPKIFYGRDGIISELLQSLRINGRFRYCGGVLLYGQTRVGKSSIRHSFIRKARETEPDVIVVDLGNLHYMDMEGTDIWVKMLDRLTQEVKMNHPQLAELLESEELCAPVEQVLNGEKSAMLLFSRYLCMVSELLQRERKMILLVADGFSAVDYAARRGNLSTDFLHTWKFMLENCGIFAVYLGQDDMPEFVQMNQNVFGRMALKKVSYLEEIYAKQLMDEPIRMEGDVSHYDAAALDELYVLTAGSAYLIVKVCNLLVEYLNRERIRRITPEILHSFLETSVFGEGAGLQIFDFEPQICDRADCSLGQANELLLLDIALHSQVNSWAERSSLKETYKDRDDRSLPVDWLLKRLLERDVIGQNSGSRYLIRVGLLAQLLRLW